MTVDHIVESALKLELTIASIWADTRVDDIGLEVPYPNLLRKHVQALG